MGAVTQFQLKMGLTSPMEVKSLILLRTLFFEEVLDEEEKGVKVSLEGDYFEQEDFNILNNIKISDDGIWI